MEDKMIEQIENSFIYHAPKDGQPEIYKQLRDEAKAFAKSIHASCPNGREKSLAITKLEEAVMWANKAIACAK